MRTFFLVLAICCAIVCASPVQVGKTVTLGRQRWVQHRRLDKRLISSDADGSSLDKRRIGINGNGVVSFLCNQPVVANVCKAVGSAVTPSPGQTLTVETPKGPVSGSILQQANRFTIRFANATRFSDPVIVNQWQGLMDGTKTATPCPQDASGGQSFLKEDCLFLNIFTPKSANGASRLPVFYWLHGGSLLFGSSTGAGLDGSNFASANNAIVVTAQYRLGVFGFLKADSAGVTGNMGLKDCIAALTFTRSIIASFGGDASRITLAGQSSGADLIRTLLATPVADSLFQRAIMQSPPANYDYWLLDNTVSSAKHRLPTQRSRRAHLFDPSSTGSSSEQTLFRFNGQNGGFSNKNRQLLFTTVRDEAAPTIDAISQSFGGTIPTDYFQSIVQQLLVPQSRADAVLASHLYDPSNSSNDARDALTLLGTEYVWRCAVQQLAINASMTRQAPAIYLAEFDVGVQYPSNSGDAYCQGKVCHEDDIYLTFGTSPGSLSPAQSRAQQEALKRWGAFVQTGNPNAPGLANWPTVGNMPQLLVFDAATGQGRVATSQGVGCKGFWGSRVPFDEQLYGP